MHPGPESHGTGAEFPNTPLSSLSRLRQSGDSSEALETLCRMYWKPVYAFIRRSWRCDREKASDSTQEFFAWAFETDFFSKFDPDRGNFRTFLKAALRNFVRQDFRRSATKKRGGDLRFVPLDDNDADRLPASLSPEDAFDQGWMAEVLLKATRLLEETLEKEGRGAWFQALKLYDFEEKPRTYQEIAGALNVSTADVCNYLHQGRLRLRESLMTCLREYIGSTDEVLTEMRDFLKM